MKSIILALGLVALLSCKKEEKELYLGDIQFMSNGEVWKEANYSVASGGYSYRFNPTEFFDVVTTKYNGDGDRRESIYIGKIPKSTGKYPVYANQLQVEDSLSNASYYFIGEDGDVIVESYHVYEKVNNFVDVQSITSEYTSGAIDITFTRDTSSAKVAKFLSDTIRLQGTFKVKLDQKK